MQPEIVALSPWMAATLLATVVGSASLLVRKRKLPQSRAAVYEPDWSVPPIGGAAAGNSFFHQWDPRLKIASLLLFCFMAASLHSLLLAISAFFMAGVSLFLSGLPLQMAARRLRALAGFLSMMLLVLPFSTSLLSGGTFVIIAGFPAVHFSVHGFLLALTIVFKASTIALLMDPLFATAPLPATIEGFRRIGVPQSICQMVFLSYRYIFVFADEMQRMYTSMLVRGYHPRCNLKTLRIMGNYFGMLFVSSYDRNQKVYEAMLCRGYDGTLPSFVTFQSTRRDWLQGVLWLLAGILLVLCDNSSFFSVHH